MDKCKEVADLTAANTTLAADVARLCDEIERLRMLVNENGETK
jgi:hypothetical protein